MRNYTACGADYFRGACRTIAAEGAGMFMVSAVDIYSPSDAYSTVRSFMRHDYTWYPVVGNHEAETASDMAWLREFNLNGTALPNIVGLGPAGCEETTYSFDYGNVPDALYNRFDSDLAATVKPIILVFGHEPAYPRPNAESGRPRHENDSLNLHPANRDRFRQRRDIRRGETPDRRAPFNRLFTPGVTPLSRSSSEW